MTMKAGKTVILTESDVDFFKNIHAVKTTANTATDNIAEISGLNINANNAYSEINKKIRRDINSFIRTI